MGKYNTRNQKISPSRFQYPADKTVTEKILKLPAFKSAMQFVSKNSIERELSILYHSSLAQITREASPMIHQMVDEAMEMFGIEVRPEVFLQRAYPMTMQIQGAERPMIIISSQLLERVSEECLWGMLASQVAGIGTGFCEIKFIQWLCSSSAGIIPDSIALPLRGLFSVWHKTAEYTFDRANLIAAEDFNVTMQAVLLGEAPPEVLRTIPFADPNCEYMKQCREYLQNENFLLDKMRDFHVLTSETLAYAARYMSLFQFYNGEYQDLREEWEG